MTRMRTLISFFGGAVAMAIVVGALAVAGVIDTNHDNNGTSTTAVVPTPTASNGKPIPPAAPTRVSQIYKNVSPGVVFVESSTSGGGANSLLGQGGGNAATGSGFVYDSQGHIVTNDHVV